MEKKKDIAVIGGGIVGIAHALAAAQSGLSVVLFERSPQAAGASIRNFGMIWPIGQAPGAIHQRALRTRDIWADIAPAAGIWHQPTGSLHLAYAEDEMAVLSEFAQRAPALGYDVELLSSQDVQNRSNAVRPDGLRGGIWSASEACVDPRQAITELPNFLAHEYGVELCFSRPSRLLTCPTYIRLQPPGVPNELSYVAGSTSRASIPLFTNRAA